MLSTEQITEKLNRYRDNVERASGFDERLFVMSDFGTWRQVLQGRSEGLREAFRENVQILEELRELLKAPLTGEAAEAFYNGVLSWIEMDRYDSCVLIEIYESLLKYYEEKKDPVREIFLNAHLALEYMEYYLRMDRHNMDMAEKTRSYALKLLEYIDLYPTLPPRTRRSFFISYYNLTGPLPDLVGEYRRDGLRFYKEAQALAHSDMVTSVEEDREMVAEEIRYLDEMMATGFPYYLVKAPEYLKEYTEVLRSIAASYEPDEEDFEMVIAGLVLEYLDGKKDIDTLIDELGDINRRMQQEMVYDGTTEGLMNLGSYMDILFAESELLKLSDKNAKEKSKLMLSLAAPLLEFIRTIPYSDHTSYYHDLFTDLFRMILPFTDGLEAKEELLMELIIRRQPITYIHSLMVEKIAGTVTEAILQENGPLAEKLTAIGGDREETLRYIIQAARLHDIGKCAVVEVINQQTRKLTDVEFGYIKMHPEKALSVVRKDDTFVRFFDVMLGHHKTYDGHGYPPSFDKQDSPYRTAVELITIADCIDAATDLLGRNYTPGKTLDTLLEELQQRKGTVYNPEIVDFICSHEALKERLRRLTGFGRTEVYFNAFKRLIERKK